MAAALASEIRLCRWLPALGCRTSKADATTLELATAGNVTVDNISAANSNTVTNLTIDAVGAITFATAKSTFNALNG